jgi:hypothetical protein
MTPLLDLTYICEYNENIEGMDHISVACISVCCVYDMIQLFVVYHDRKSTR